MNDTIQNVIWTYANLHFSAVNEADSLGCYIWHEDLGEVEDRVRAEAGGVRGLLPEGLCQCSIACSDNQLGGAGFLQHGDQNGTQYWIITPVI